MHCISRIQCFRHPLGAPGTSCDVANNQSLPESPIHKHVHFASWPNRTKFAHQHPCASRPTWEHGCTRRTTLLWRSQIGLPPSDRACTPTCRVSWNTAGWSRPASTSTVKITSHHARKQRRPLRMSDMAHGETPVSVVAQVPRRRVQSFIRTFSSG